MKGWPRALLCGDFNFDDRKTWGDWRRRTPARGPEALENRVLREVLPDWVDAWPAIHSSKPGITFDGAANRHIRDRHEIMRYDRVMVRCGAGALVTQAARLLGTSQTSASPSGLLPSDHYGLLVDVDVDCHHNTTLTDNVINTCKSTTQDDGIRAHDRPADGQAVTSAERAAIASLELRDGLR
uniref:Endonuclease/exonuclease/phosphatase domain-containing protein n=1 Tax=Calcidiscus leptoporus TaxID=127549 RepID=A0A7S0J8R4_9EUKA|mmetsp:Transcript_453/g.1013  ORF Transcript_453/g.1013 Transcript_453/m.1013 type:complete len:183 (+) Transcript_453:8-556(+)